VAQLLPKGTTARYARFDPLERVFFLTIMFLFIPIQILTGILLFDVYTMLPIIKLMGGLRVVDAIHIACAYLLVSFMIIHVYFHTLKKYRIPARTTVS
jgi:thiosulfate reductase cytochrome b subunit